MSIATSDAQSQGRIFRPKSWGKLFLFKNKVRMQHVQGSGCYGHEDDFHNKPPAGLTLFISFWLTMHLGNSPPLLKSI